MSHMKLTGHIGGRHKDGVGFLAAIPAGMEEVLLSPKFIPLAFVLFRIVSGFKGAHIYLLKSVLGPGFGPGVIDLDPIVLLLTH